jgi:hypothetical protein
MYSSAFASTAFFDIKYRKIVLFIVRRAGFVCQILFSPQKRQRKKFRRRKNALIASLLPRHAHSRHCSTFSFWVLSICPLSVWNF